MSPHRSISASRFAVSGRRPIFSSFLEERSAGISVEALRSLGLTNRQTEILAWIAQGKTNPEIGQILGVSPRTVQKHIEHLYQKLDIETRAAAVAIAMQCCQQTDIGS